MATRLNSAKKAKKKLAIASKLQDESIAITKYGEPVSFYKDVTKEARIATIEANECANNTLPLFEKDSKYKAPYEESIKANLEYLKKTKEYE